MSPLKFNKEDEIQQISESFNIVRDKMRESQKNNEELNEALSKLRKEEEYKKKFVQLLYEEKREKDTISNVAQHDGLTGLYNRRTFDDFVNEFIVRRPGNKDGALFLIDMDNFKGVNDSLGHLQGDEALKTLAGAMRVVFSGGYLGRYGGDEFIAFIVGCTTETDMERYAGELCRKMHKKLEYNGKTVQLSVSIGAASSVGIKACSELYTRADKALYHSKENGRNRYTVFTDALEKANNIHGENVL
ncbi:MAG: GGDEF domain-containing protein, partial [Butyrivibrio sp.]